MIYMITNKLTGKSFISETKQNLKTRFSQHWYQRNNMTYKNTMYTDMANSEITDWDCVELEEFEDVIAAITFYNTVAPNGYNNLSDTRTAVKRDSRYKYEKIMRNDGVVYLNVNTAAEILHNEEKKGTTVGSCKTNLLQHLRGVTKSCYGYVFTVIEHEWESAE